jgi:hypothetical protein
MVTTACVRSVMRFAPITQLGVTAEGTRRYLPPCA